MARKKKQQQSEEAGFGEPATRGRLTPVDIQQKVFRLAFRGYNERDVDEFLDRITEDLAALHEENKRLRELGGGGGEDVEAARAQAETIVREAREHAARLTEDTGGGAGGGGLSAAFLLRERDFLQQMARSVQDHARWLKEEAQRQRAAGAQVTSPPPKAKSDDEGKRGRANAKAKDAGEATAAWGPPQKGMAEPTAGWSGEQRAGEPDPLLSAWESAFTGDAPKGTKAAREGEPSLRELFWGEE